MKTLDYFDILQCYMLDGLGMLIDYSSTSKYTASSCVFAKLL